MSLASHARLLQWPPPLRHTATRPPPLPVRPSFWPASAGPPPSGAPRAYFAAPSLQPLARSRESLKIYSNVACSIVSISLRQSTNADKPLIADNPQRGEQLHKEYL